MHYLREDEDFGYRIPAAEAPVSTDLRVQQHTARVQEMLSSLAPKPGSKSTEIKKPKARKSPTRQPNADLRWIPGGGEQYPAVFKRGDKPYAVPLPPSVLSPVGACYAFDKLDLDRKTEVRAMWLPARGLGE